MAIEGPAALGIAAALGLVVIALLIDTFFQYMRARREAWEEEDQPWNR